MAHFDIELVGKIGSMALVQKDGTDIDYNIIARVSRQLRPGMIWVSSGAVEIGRLDYLKRNSWQDLPDDESLKEDLAAQGQTILMQNYRSFISAGYSVRQLLVEHHHFNDSEKREHIRQFLLRCVKQNAIPIVNYNDPVSSDELRNMELASFRMKKGATVECVDNDETAAVLSVLTNARMLIILTNVDGIYKTPGARDTLITEISGKDAYDVIENIRATQEFCRGASRAGSNGAYAKLEYIIPPVQQGTTVIIANAKYHLKDIIGGKVPLTKVGIR